ncbi:hypothetical protein PF003_g9215 [Phytophthora fragariae]|nr:hypothetical protein PF003_g9215 [Phytophthora fragariae]
MLMSSSTTTLLSALLLIFFLVGFLSANCHDSRELGSSLADAMKDVPLLASDTTKRSLNFSVASSIC